MLLPLRRNRLEYQKYLRELYEKKQTRVYSGIILTLTTISFFALFALRPTILTITGLVAEIGQKEETIRRLDVKIRQLSQAQAAYAQLAPRLYLIDEALPTDTNLYSLMNNLEMAAARNEVSFLTLSFGEIGLDEKKEELEEVNFEVSLKGQFGHLKDFLEKIFLLRRIIQSSQLSLAKPTIEEERSLVFSAQLISFFKRK